MTMMRKLVPCALVGVLLLAGCNSQPSGPATGTGNNGLSVSIVEPVRGALVQLPFQVKFTSSEELGTMSSGKHHVHVWFDDDTANYIMIESDSGKIEKAPAGSHTMHVSLRKADHSPAGAEAELMVTVAGGAPGTGIPAPSPTSGSDY